MKNYILIVALLFLNSCRETTISEKKDFVKEEEKQSKILNTPFSKIIFLENGVTIKITRKLLLK